jgi:hypothetical protein
MLIPNNLVLEIHKIIEKEQNLCHHDYFIVNNSLFLLKEGVWQRCVKCKKMLDVTNGLKELYKHETVRQNRIKEVQKDEILKRRGLKKCRLAINAV